MKNVLFLFVLAIIAFTACQRENMFPNRVLEGVVVDSTTQLALSGVKISVCRWEVHGIWNSYYEETVIGFTETDDNGYWKMKIRPDKDRLYFLSFGKQSYYNYSIRFDNEDFPDYQQQLIPKAFIRFNITDNTENSFNNIQVECINPHSVNTMLTICAEYLPETMIKDAIGNTCNKINWTKYIATDCQIKNDSPSASFADSVWVDINDTVDYDINL